MLLVMVIVQRLMISTMLLFGFDSSDNKVFMFPQMGLET
ncbi:unnamed protein product [Linum tenue]|uniref:Uncharacterized protein n=1 Tax=Linum tenue TaxID=586396 RepID=A0AAV0NCA1_9ROSI|nr:unnamed protein product [Linum tenue]